MICIKIENSIRTMLGLSVVVLLLLLSPLIHAQDNDEPRVVKTSGEAITEVSGKISLEMARENALQNARINAIEKAFGTAIFQGNSTYVKNIVNGKEAKTETVFNMIADSYVTGEWIEDIKPPKFETIADDNKIFVKCNVYGQVRELTRPKISFESYTLNKPDISYRTDQFRHQQQLYLYFKSPSAGYITVFYVSNNEAFRILPYQQMPPDQANMLPVEADKNYIFFDREKSETIRKNLVDELILEAEGSQTLDRIFVIFSPQIITKPGLLNRNQVYLSKTDMDLGFAMPKSLPATEFQKWLTKNRNHNKQIEVATIDVSISNE